MIITRKFIKTHTFKDPIDAVSKMQDQAYMLDLLEKKYVNKCHDGVFIVRILKIYDLQSSPMTILKNSLQGYANHSVEFDAECRVFSYSEPLIGCVYIQNVKDLFYCSHSLARILFKWSSDNKYQFFLRPSQLVPVVTVSTRYEVDSAYITVRARVYTPTLVDEVFKISASAVSKKDRIAKNLAVQYMSDQYMSINEQIADIDAELAWLDTAEPVAKAFFIDLVTVKMPAGAMAPTGRAVNYIELARAGTTIDANVMVILPYVGNMLTPIVYVEHIVAPLIDPIAAITSKSVSVADIINKSIGGTVVPTVCCDHAPIAGGLPGTPLPQPILQSSMIPHLLTRYYNHLKLLRGFIEVYHSAEIRTTHDNLWLFYNKMKKQGPA